jgi:23S rRNA pseudouridine2605 synthase
MLNTPRGYLTTMRDEFGRATVAQLVRDVGVRLHPVGRLDRDSEGLLILTNDGSFTNSMTHPSFEKKKTYRVTVRGDVRSAVEPLGRSMSIDGYAIRPAAVKLISMTDDGGVLEITIHEGRNRQIRKMCAQTGLQVLRLVRTAADGITLTGLKPGEWRVLRPDEMTRLICTNGCKNESGR